MNSFKITVNEIRNRINHGETVYLVDVREAEEFANEHVDGSINEPLSTIEKKPFALDKAVPVYLLCKTGRRAEIAAGLLSTWGFRDIHVVAGGLLAWITQGFPLFKG